MRLVVGRHTRSNVSTLASRKDLPPPGMPAHATTMSTRPMQRCAAYSAKQFVAAHAYGHVMAPSMRRWAEAKQFRAHLE